MFRCKVEEVCDNTFEYAVQFIKIVGREVFLCNGQFAFAD